MHGFLDEALENFLEALRTYQEMIPDSHEDLGMCESISIIMSLCTFLSAVRFQISLCLFEKDRLSQAYDFSRAGLSIVRAVGPPEHPFVALGK